MIKQLILSVAVSMTAVGCSKSDEVTIVQVITTSSGKKIVDACRKNVVSCMPGGLTDNRTIRTSGDSEYHCNFENDLFLIKTNNDSITNINQGKCTYQAFERTKYIDGNVIEKEIL